MITTQHPLRHPLQIIVSLGQLYGDVLYYSTSLFDHYYKGLTYCRPEAYYFWTYFIIMNAFWIVIPLGELFFTDTLVLTRANTDNHPIVLICSSANASSKAFKALDRMSKTLQSNGHAKKSN